MVAADMWWVGMPGRPSFRVFPVCTLARRTERARLLFSWGALPAYVRSGKKKRESRSFGCCRFLFPGSPRKKARMDRVGGEGGIVVCNLLMAPFCPPKAKKWKEEEGEGMKKEEEGEKDLP